MSTSARTMLLDKVRGCLYGGAIGDAMGAPVEGRKPQEIRDRYGLVTGFVEPWDGPSPTGKGDGRYTDDTHMVQVLGRIYVEAGAHLDAFSFARRVVPLIADEPRWVPEYGREMKLVDRLFYPEKWLLLRLRLANADPRQAGAGNMVNCGAAMYAAPAGIVNACDPRSAYREAIEIFSAHQWSYGLEAAGVMAACVAEAFNPESTVDSIVAAALAYAREGTRAAIEAVTSRARDFRDWREAIGPLREAMRPFDGAAEDFHGHGDGNNHRTPSREHSIEELPIALGILVVAGGDFEQTIFGSANYGRDCDSIAGMAGAIAGALHGARAIRPGWMARINVANRVDLGGLANALADLAHRLQQQEVLATRERDWAFARLGEQPERI